MKKIVLYAADDGVEFLNENECMLYKKYAINGNHDDIDMWKSVISDSGFIDIRDNYDLIYMNDVKPILISGLDQDSDKVNKYIDVVNKNSNVDEFNDLKEEIETSFNASECKIDDYNSEINFENIIQNTKDEDIIEEFMKL